jgi:hypothetical protein
MSTVQWRDAATSDLEPDYDWAFLMALGQHLLPEHAAFADGTHLIRQAAAANAAETVWTVCNVAVSASLPLRRMYPHRDFDRAASFAGGLSAERRQGRLVAEFIRITGNFRFQVCANPERLLEVTHDPMTIVGIGQRVCAGYVRLTATTVDDSIESTFIELCDRVLELEGPADWK